MKVLFQDIVLFSIAVFWLICLERWLNEDNLQEIAGDLGILNSRRFLFRICLVGLTFILGKIFIYKGNDDFYKLIFLWAFFLGLLIISIIDLSKQVIYTENILLEFIFCISYFWVGKVHLEMKILGSLMGITIMGLIYLSFSGGMGSGDIYLTSVLGFWLGFPLVVLCIIMAFIFAGSVGLTYLWVDARNLRKNIPFAPFLCVASLISFYWGVEIIIYYQEIFS